MLCSKDKNEGSEDVQRLAKAEADPRGPEELQCWITREHSKGRNEFGLFSWVLRVLYTDNARSTPINNTNAIKQITKYNAAL